MNGYAHGYKSKSPTKDYKQRQYNNNKRECAVAKTACRIRYNHICQICGDEGIDAHHIDFDETHNSQDNLICLCRSCHLRVHLGIYNYNNDKYTIDEELFADKNELPDYLISYMDKYNYKGAIFSTSGLKLLNENNKLVKVSIKAIKNDLGYTKYNYKLDHERIHKLNMVRQWNTNVNRYVNKSSWHNIINFLKHFNENDDNDLKSLNELYELTKKNN